MRLHGHMRIQMVQCPIGFFASVPTAFVHSLDLFVASPRSLVLLGTGYGYKGVDLLHVRQ